MTVADRTDDLLEQLLAQPDEAAQQAFLARPEVKEQAGVLVEKLVAKVDFYCRSEPPQAVRLADLALLTADTTSIDAAQGLAQRAKGHSLRAVGRFQEALPYYSEAVTRFKRANLPNEEGRTYLGEVAALSSLGQTAECFKRGKAIRRRLNQLSDNLNLAKLNANLAVVNFQTGRYQSAIRLYNRTIQLWTELEQPEWIPVSQVNRANSLVQLNRFRQATKDYEVSRAFFVEKGMVSAVAQVDLNLGYLLFQQGRYNEALNLLLAAREGFESVSQPHERAKTELDLGSCYSALGLYADALAMYEQAARTMAEFDMKNEALWVEIGLAQTLLNTGELEQALQRLQTFLESYEAIGANERNRHALGVAWLYLAQMLGRLATDNAEYSYTQALEYCRQAKAVFEELKLTNWFAQSLIVEADLLRQAQQWATATLAYEAAFKPIARLKLPHLLYQIHYGFGRLKQDQAALPTSDAQLRQELIEAARQQYTKATQQVETIRAILRPEEWRSAFMENGLSAYEALVELCLQEADNPTRLAEAFSYIERSKSRSLLDMLSQGLSDTSQNDNDEKSQELAQRIEELRQELNWYYSQAHSLQSPGGDNNQRVMNIEPEKIAQQLESREWELAKLLRRYRPSLLPEGSTLSLGKQKPAQLAQQLSQRLQAHQTFVEYYILNDTVIAFVINGEGIQGYHELCSLEQVTNLQERLTFQANKFNLGSDYTKRHLTTLHQSFDLYLKELYGLLLAPLSERLNGTHLIVAPHGPLHTLPFHALHDGQQYLIQRFEVSFAPSAAVLLHCLNQPERPPHKLLGLAVPDEYLPGVETEVRGLAQFFPESRLLIGPEATFEGLASNLGWCDVLHLASHGVFREDNPLFSLLKLADGWLSVHDVMGWRFRPSLVTLSACQTGLTRPLRGDELLGLARGFLAAGASSLVVSLWSVSDEVTTDLMHLFYTALSQGHTRTAALRHAMLAVLGDERYSHPHFWAAFVVLGRP